MKGFLFVALGIFAAGFMLLWARAARKMAWPTPLEYAVGLGTQFLDTLGIGSFATMSSSFKIWSMVRDEDIPGTMNLGTVLTGILEAFIYLAVIDVDVPTLVLMVAAAVLGAWLGAGVVSRWPRRKIQIGMAAALLATAAFGLAAGGVEIVFHLGALLPDLFRVFEIGQRCRQPLRIEGRVWEESEIDRCPVDV